MFERQLLTGDLDQAESVFLIAGDLNIFGLGVDFLLAVAAEPFDDVVNPLVFSRLPSCAKTTSRD